MSYAIAQVNPFPWEEGHEVTSFVSELSEELARRGHRVLVLTPSSSPDLVRESRRRIRRSDLFDPDGGVSVLGVGELLPLGGTGRRAQVPALPVDISRTLEEALEVAELDFVHVHEPFAPSAGSIALRHSRALNVGTFHAPTERVLSTSVARRFVELFFGRLDARTVSYPTTGRLIDRFFPADYLVIPPGATIEDQGPRGDGPVRIGFADVEERAALRLFLRALRRLPRDLEWEAVVGTATGAAPVLGTLRDRVSLLRESDPYAGADIAVLASSGQAPAPGHALRAIANGAVPLTARVGAYDDVLDDGTLGLYFEPGDVDTLTPQLERLVRDGECRARYRAEALHRAAQLSWGRVADDYEHVFASVAGRRHATVDRPDLRRRLSSRPLIDVDLHMHTDHSHDCATPVDVLLATARDRGLGAIAVTDHNEVSGALDAAAKAAEYGVKVIVGEEVKTGGQGEVIGLFLQEKIPRGLTMAETIAEIRRQGGLVYVPHPFDRLHTVPDYEHLLEIVEDVDAIEIFNPRVAISAFNEEAVRFAAKYRIVAGAGSDAHVAQGLGSVRIRMRDFDGPEEFLESLREADIVRRPTSLLYVQALKFLQTKATPAPARRATRRRKVARAVATRESSPKG